MKVEPWNKRRYDWWDVEEAAQPQTPGRARSAVILGVISAASVNGARRRPSKGDEEMHGARNRRAPELGDRLPGQPIWSPIIRGRLRCACTSTAQSAAGASAITDRVCSRTNRSGAVQATVGLGSAGVWTALLYVQSRRGWRVP
ncbi:hypothetical protein VTO73DRAFT_13528 [Trametes versicolor]